MMKLHVFGPAFGLPDPSPFCMKADILLQMSGLPFARVTGNLRKAPKGKLPVLVDGGVTVADSSFIRFHLESRHGVDFDGALTPAQRGAAWAVEKLLEDHLYWLVVHERWLDAANFDRGPRHFFAAVPAPLRPIVVALVKRKVARNLDGQGLGRHSPQERLSLGQRACTAVADILGDKPFLMGDVPCGADATLGAFLIAALCPLFTSTLRGEIESREALVAYAQRISARYFADREPVRPGA